MRPDALPLPNWPATLTTEMAARYLMVGENTFRAIAARSGIRPVDLGASLVRWRRSDLDGLVDKLPARGADCVDLQPNEIDPAAAALERVRRRRAKPQ